MKVNREISNLNAFSFVVYYGVRVFGLVVFVITLIPIALVLGPIFPAFFKNLSANLDAYTEQESKNIDINWERLSNK